MLSVILWYVSLSVLGWLAFPIAYRFLPKLPDRGYTLSRAVGMLMWAFVFWLLGSYGVLGNDAGGLIVALLALIGLSVWAWKSLPKGELGKWLNKNVSLIVGVEVLFVIAFVAMILLRASNPAISHTEQPMELAFINAILRSPSMPPHDPWLSGFSISYYYSGYVMVAMLAKVSGVAGAVAFNLGMAMVFAMAALGAYGFAYNLLAIKRPDAQAANRWGALLAPLFVLVMGNLEGFLEILHAQHLFWGVDAEGNAQSAFWSWLNIKDLVFAPTTEVALQPRNYGTGSWWWWRASRVINDLNFAGFEQELIDEFPAFSFVLGDLHPHVLSMPFAFLAMGLGFNLHLGGADSKKNERLLGLHIDWQQVVFFVIVLGGLAFLNIWDFPIYLLLMTGLYFYRRAQAEGWAFKRTEDAILLLVVVGLGGVIAYLPFYLGFSSQAGGLLPNLFNPTRGAHLWVMFATLLIPLITYLFYLLGKQWDGRGLGKAFGLSFGLVAALWISSIGLAWLFVSVLPGNALSQAIGPVLEAPDLGSLLSESLRRRTTNLGGWLTLGLLLSIVLGLLWPQDSTAATKKRKNLKRTVSSAENTFVLLMTLFAGLLVLAPEFVYLRDHFGTRMNTVFKFYMQAWLIWGVVAAYSVVILLSELRRVARVLVLILFVVVLGAGMVYPAFAFPDVYVRAEGQPLNLDGSAYILPDELEAIAWLQAAPLRPLVEAVKGSYDPNYARFATNSGQPTVMGWPGHESQWRGGSVDFVPRIGDVERLYTSSDWTVTSEILEKYEVGYLAVGNVERATYLVNEIKFQNHLEIAFQNNSVTIYLVP
jgi:YYY domain-containing protein